MTNRFRFEGKLVLLDEDNTKLEETTPVTGEEAKNLFLHMLHALNAYEKDGFKFVDVDGGGTLSTGEFEFGWSDYGIEKSVDNPADGS